MSWLLLSLLLLSLLLLLLLLSLWLYLWLSLWLLYHHHHHHHLSTTTSSTTTISESKLWNLTIELRHEIMVHALCLITYLLINVTSLWHFWWYWCHSALTLGKHPTFGMITYPDNLQSLFDFWLQDKNILVSFLLWGNTSHLAWGFSLTTCKAFRIYG